MTALICRICGTNENLRHVSEGGKELLEMLSLCANILIRDEDCLPKHLCQQCELGLNFSYRLRRKGEETEQRIRQEMEMESSKHNQLKPTTTAIKALIEEDSLDTNEEEFIDEVLEDEDVNEKSQATIIGEVVALEEPLLINTTEYNEIPEYIEYSEYDIIEEDVQALEIEQQFNEVAEEQVMQAQLENGTHIDSIDLLTEDEQNISDENGEDMLQQNNAVIVSYTCATCLQVCTNQTDYRQHIKQHGSERFHCIQCNKWFPTRFRLQKHEQCHSANVELHQCPHCERTYRMRSNLVRHVRATHESERPFACHLCPERFGRADVLKNHMDTHIQERKFTCMQCQESFKTQRYLDSHMRTHQPKAKKKKQTRPSAKASEELQKAAADSGTSPLTSKKDYHCAHCGKISKHHFTHKNHMRTHTHERPYACETCSKKFRTMAARITHERIHVDVRPYQCEHCLVSFRQQSHLKEHRLIHAGVMAHVCSVCSQAFTKKSNMRVHMRTHTGELPYKCAACAQCFSKLALLKRHAAAVHGNVVMWESRDDAEVALANEEEEDLDQNDYQDDNDGDGDDVDLVEQQQNLMEAPFVPPYCEIVSISDILPDEIDIIL